jgi:hypothetical protein
MTKLNTTQKFVLQLMQQDALLQTFVVGAIDLHIQHVLAQPEEDLKSPVAFINPKAWRNAALEAQKALHAYTNIPINQKGLANHG